MTVYRILDLAISVLALLFLLPILLAVAFILRFTGEGEIFYLQERVGKQGRIFFLYKFATMLRNSPDIGTGALTVKDDPRVLPFGRFLRKTKINELPQLVNIVKGELSIVGPRPMVPQTHAMYSEESRIAIESDVPGLTGLGSIVFRDEEKFLNNVDSPEKIYREQIIPFKGHLEIWYSENRSLGLYLLIILATALAILVPNIKWQGVFFEASPRMPSNLDQL